MVQSDCCGQQPAPHSQGGQVSRSTFSVVSEHSDRLLCIIAIDPTMPQQYLVPLGLVSTWPRLYVAVDAHVAHSFGMSVTDSVSHSSSKFSAALQTMSSKPWSQVPLHFNALQEARSCCPWSLMWVPSLGHGKLLLAGQKVTSLPHFLGQVFPCLPYWSPAPRPRDSNAMVLPIRALQYHQSLVEPAFQHFA